MEQAGKDILDRNASEKMCSLVGNEAGEICSSADADTCGDGSNAFTLKIWQCSEYKSRVWQGRR